MLTKVGEVIQPGPSKVVWNGLDFASTVCTVRGTSHWNMSPKKINAGFVLCGFVFLSCIATVVFKKT